MKMRLFGFLTLLITIFSLQSCKEDIELIGDYEQTAVVYGLLDQSDSIHMIKITRAFIGPGDALVFATIPDSNYFASVTGTVTEFINNAPGRVFTLRDTLVDNKDEDGAFYAPTQKLYYFTTSVSSPLLGSSSDNIEYKLNLSINNGLFTVNGSTKLVSGMTENISGKIIPFSFAQSNNIDFTSTVVAVNTGTSHQVNTKLTLEFEEFDGVSSTTKNVSWSLGEQSTSPGNTIAFNAAGQTFFSLIKNNITNDPSIIERRFKSITTTVVGGSEELAKYILVNEPSSSLAQNNSTYTNLTTSNGSTVVGLFSARQTLKVRKDFIDPFSTTARCINLGTTRYLCTGAECLGLLFCSHHNGDLAQSFACP